MAVALASVVGMFACQVAPSRANVAKVSGVVTIDVGQKEIGDLPLPCLRRSEAPTRCYLNH